MKTITHSKRRARQQRAYARLLSFDASKHANDPKYVERKLAEIASLKRSLGLSPSL